jgi:regulatory protein
LKQWGKIKIKYELKLKGVSEYNIKKGLTIISDNDYSATLLKLATAKWKLLKTEQYIHREIKTTNYLMQKGYEPVLIKATIQLLKEKAPK